MKKYLLLFFLMCIGSQHLHAQDTSDTTLVGKRVRIATVDRMVIEGVILSDNENHLRIQVNKDKVVVVAKLQIKEIIYLDQPRKKALNDSIFEKQQHVYFFNSTSFPLEKKTAQFDVTLPAMIAVSGNLSSRFSLSMRYLLFAALDFSANLRVQIAPKLNLSFRAAYMIQHPTHQLTDLSGINLSTKISIGDKNHNVSLGFGGYSTVTNSESSMVLSFSGITTLAKRWMLIGDGSYIFDKNLGIFATGIRFLGDESWSVDLGIFGLFFPYMDRDEFILDRHFELHPNADHLFLPFVGFHKKF